MTALIRDLLCSSFLLLSLTWEQRSIYFDCHRLELAMAVQTYTPRELLRLKKAPIRKELYSQLQANLRQDQELGIVLPFRYYTTFTN